MQSPRFFASIGALVLALLVGLQGQSAHAQTFSFTGLGDAIRPADCGLRTGVVSAGQRVVNVSLVAACADKAIAVGKVLRLEGRIEINGTMDLRAKNSLTLDCGSGAEIYQYGNGIPTLQAGGQDWNMRACAINYVLPQTLANAGANWDHNTGDGTGANGVELWNLRYSIIAGLKIDNAARCVTIPQAPGEAYVTIFSTNVMNISCTRFTHTAFDLQCFSGGCTGSHFTNFYAKTGGIGDRRDVSACAIFANFDENESTQLNCEHMRPGAVTRTDSMPGDAVVVASGTRSLTITGFHGEGVEPSKTAMSWFYAGTNTLLTVDGGTLSSNFYLGTNNPDGGGNPQALTTYLVRMFGTGSAFRIRGLSAHGNTFTNGSLLAMLKCNTGLSGGQFYDDGLASFDSISYTSNSCAPTDNREPVIRTLGGREVRTFPAVGRAIIPPMSANGTLTVANAKLYATLVRPEGVGAIDQIGPRVATPQSGAQCRSGVYAYTGSETQPGALLTETSGVADASISGARYVAITTALTVFQRPYWSAVMCYATTAGTLPTLDGLSQGVANWFNSSVGGDADLANLNSSALAHNGVTADMTGTITSAADWNALAGLPAVFPSATLNLGSNMPFAGLRVGATP